MADYAVAADERAAYGKTLAAATVDTVTFGRGQEVVRVVNDTGTAAIFVTADGTAPVVDGPKTYRVRAIAGDYVDIPVGGGGSSEVVKLISSGTPTYSVEGSA